jgi:hypothetical protein
MDIASTWAKLLTDAGKLAEALDAGEEGVVTTLGDALDDYIATICPAYSAVRQACDLVPKEAFDCTADRINIRNGALRAILEASGIMALIRALVDAWNSLPESVKQVVRKAAVIWSSIGDLVSDPSIEHLIALVGAVGELASVVVDEVIGLFIGLADYAGEFVTTVIEDAWWVIARSPEAIASLVKSLPEASGVGQLFRDLSTGDVISLIKNAATLPLQAIYIVGDAIVSAFGGGSNAQPYQGEWEWGGVPFAMPALMKTALAENPVIAAPYEYDYLLNFGLTSAANEFRVRGKLGDSGSYHPLFIPSLWCVTDYRQLIPTSYAGPIGSDALNMAVALITNNQYSWSRSIKESMLRTIMNAPRSGDKADANGLAWLVGPGGRGTLSELFASLGQTTIYDGKGSERVKAFNLAVLKNNQSKGVNDDTEIRLINVRGRSTWFRAPGDHFLAT